MLRKMNIELYVAVGTVLLIDPNKHNIIIFTEALKRTNVDVSIYDGSEVSSGRRLVPNSR